MKNFEKIVLLVGWLMCANFGYGHDLRMAIFEISQVEDTYYLEMSFDKEDLHHALISSLGEKPTSENLEQLINDYLESNFQVAINYECITPNVKRLIVEEEYIRVTANLPIKATKVSTISIFNSCLLENSGHMNIIKSKLNKRSRTFRLSSERQSTLIDYRS